VVQFDADVDVEVGLGVERRLGGEAVVADEDGAVVVATGAGARWRGGSWSAQQALGLRMASRAALSVGGAGGRSGDVEPGVAGWGRRGEEAVSMVEDGGAARPRVHRWGWDADGLARLETTPRPAGGAPIVSPPALRLRARAAGQEAALPGLDVAVAEAMSDGATRISKGRGGRERWRRSGGERNGRRVLRPL
jgi:hypothetical protein